MDATVIRSRIKWMTLSAVFIAMLVVAQGFTAQFGNQLVTGSLVNLVLIMSAMTSGLPVGLTTALVSPVLAYLFGIGPQFPLLIPFIMAGNAVFVTAWHFMGNAAFVNPLAANVLALVLAAVVKFAVLYVGAVKVAIPFLLDLKPPQVAAMSAMFSYPQLITASIGGAVAIAVLPLVRRGRG